jgi:hypothetical protein
MEDELFREWRIRLSVGGSVGKPGFETLRWVENFRLSG